MKTLKKGSAAVLSALCLCAVCGTMPAANVSAANLLTADFETTDDSFSGRGGAKVGWTQDQGYVNNCSLFVSGRTSSWQGAERDASKFMKAGNTYNMSVAVYQETGEDVEMKFSLQYTNAEGKTGYDKIALETASSGQWLVLSNESYTVPEGATGLIIYVETTESLCDFYIDAVTVNGAPSVIKTGDANGDLKVNMEDAVCLAKFLDGEDTVCEPGADLNGDSIITAVDLSLLKYDLLNPPEVPTFSDWDNYVENVDPATLQIYKDGVMRLGNTARIRDKISKAMAGEKITIGYLGGSITRGGSSSSDATCYVTLSGEYFKNTFAPSAEYVNAGEPGTSSVVGNMRVDSEIYAKNCDIVFIEFAVNDQGGDRFQKSYESLVKKTLNQPNEPAVILVTLCQKDGGSNQDWMAKIGENYDLPIISGKNAIMNAIKAGTRNWDRDYGSGDNIHPGDGGHKMIADIIGYYYRQALRTENASDSYEVPSTEVFGANYATSRMVDISSLDNFQAGSWKKGTNQPKYSGGYTYSKSGNDPMKFTCNGKGILLLFQSNKEGSGMGTVEVTVNGKTNKVSAQLPWTWGGLDGDVGYYQPNSDKLDISIKSADGGTFVLYGIAVIE